jgi:hypothetical protein
MPRKKHEKRVVQEIPLLTPRGNLGGLRDPPGGRPPHIPTEAQKNLAKICSALGKPRRIAAELMGVSVNTLIRHYAKEWELGKDNVDVAVAGKLISAATSPQHTGPTVEAAKFWAETQMGWIKGSVLQVTGKDGGPVQIEDAREIIRSRIAGIAERLAEDSDPRRLN